jgi:hypothetical protein
MLNSAEILYAYLKLMNYLRTQKFYVRNVMRNCKDFTRLVDFFFINISKKKKTFVSDLNESTEPLLPFITLHTQVLYQFTHKSTAFHN